MGLKEEGEFEAKIQELGVQTNIVSAASGMMI